MRKYILVLIILVFAVLQACAFEDITLPQEGYDASYNAQIQEKISNEEFSDLEKKVFKKTFPNDSAQKRMIRLEKELLGMEQNGNIEDRFDNLITASQYYQEGYRAGEKSNYKTENNKVNTYDKLDSWNYIQTYDLPESYEDYSAKNNYQPEQKYYYEDYNGEKARTQPKPSAIKQFFSNLASILSAGAVTGYTLPMTGSYGLSPIDTYTNFIGPSYIGMPQFPNYVYSPSNRIPNRYYSPHIPPRHRPVVPQNSARSYGSGAGVRLIY